MTIVSSLDYQPTFRERQEFEVMMTLEKAVTGDEPIQTIVLADRIVDAVEEIASYEEERRANETGKTKPRIRIPAMPKAAKELLAELDGLASN